MSVATDLAMGLPAGHAIRACLAATRLARRLNLADRDVAAVYHFTLKTDLIKVLRSARHRLTTGPRDRLHVATARCPSASEQPLSGYSHG